jgi:uncharacterized membrane protein
MTYAPITILHVAGGLVAIVAGFVALFVRKGGRLHRKSGDVFVVSMLFMASAGAYAAVIKSQPVNVVAGVFTFYLVASAWLTVRRKANETGRMEVALLVLALCGCIGAAFLAWQAVHMAKRGGPAPYVVFGLIALLSASGDIRMLIRGGVAGAQRLVRHVWRMGLALFVATGSFFLGMAGDPLARRIGLRARLFTPEIRKTQLPLVPVLIVAALTIFWLLKVKLSKRYKTAAV